MTATPPSPPTETLSQACARHEAYLRGRLRGLGVAEAGLDDAVQDVFEVLVRRFGAYDSRFSLRQWMAGVARKIARRHRERGQRAPEALDEDQHASTALDPERWAARQEALGDLQAFLRELDPDRWAVFVLSEIEGLRGTEIAAELGVNLSTVYARLRVAKDCFARTMAWRRREEQRSWLLLPLFGGPAGRPRAAFMTPVALLGLLTAGGGALLAVRGCVQDSVNIENDGSAARERTASARDPSAGPQGVQAREADPASVMAPEHGEAAAERDSSEWIAGPGGSSSQAAATWTETTRYRLRGDEMIVEIVHVGDDAVAMDGGVGWVELEGLERVEGPGSWAIMLAAKERLVITLRLRAKREGVVRAELQRGRRIGEPNAGGGVWLVHEGGALRRCRQHECERTAATIGDSLIGETVGVDLHNRCEVAIEVAMLPCELQVPPPDASRIRLAADEMKAVTVDAGLCFGRVKPDGRLGGSVGGSDGFLIEFAGEDCGTVSAQSKDLPPALRATGGR